VFSSLEPQEAIVSVAKTKTTPTLRIFFDRKITLIAPNSLNAKMPNGTDAAPTALWPTQELISHFFLYPFGQEGL
jgi:hypothetical protein